MAISCWETAQQLYLHLYALITFSNILLGWPITSTSQVQPCTLHRSGTAGCSQASPSSPPIPILQPNPFPVPGIPPRSSPLHPWSSSGSIFRRHMWQMQQDCLLPNHLDAGPRLSLSKSPQYFHSLLLSTTLVSFP